MKKISKQTIYIMVLAVALVLRVLVAAVWGHQMFLGTDDDNYRESAQILLSQGTLTYGGWPGPTVFIMPGYAIFLAGIFAIFGSPNWLAARLIQAVIGAGAVWLTMKIGEKMGGFKAGLLAGLLAALYPPNLTASSFIMTEGIFTFFLLLSLWYLVSAGDLDDMRILAATGLVLGISIYFRPTSGLLSFVFIPFFFAGGLNWRKAIKNVFIIGIISLIVLSPWILRNYIQFKTFIPFTISGGNPFLRGTYIDDRIDEKFPWVKGDRIASDQLQMERGKQRLREGFSQDFKGYAYWYTLGKFKKMWLEPYYFRPLKIIPWYMAVLIHKLFLMAGVLGLVMGFIYRRNMTLLLLAVLGYFTLMNLVYLAAPRYSYPVFQLVLIAAGYGISKIITFFTHTSI